MISRSSRGGLAEWWWTVDRLSIFVVLTLIGIGLVLAFAASPAASGGPLTEGDFRYAIKQIAFAAMAAGILIVASFLSPAQIGRLASLLFAAALVASFMVVFVGTETYGAHRWFDFGWISLQPSEFLKPGFAVLVAAVLGARAGEDGLKLADWRVMVTAMLLAPALVALLLQPDVGQTFLMLALWAALLFFAGLPQKWIWMIGGGAMALGTTAYFFFDHVHRRVNQFLDSSLTARQAEYAERAFAHGGFFGVGPGAGTVKYRLPEAHSDYIYAVAGEEFGFLVCAAIALLFCVLAVRLMLRAASFRDPFIRLAGAGLAVVVALQAFINMGVAVGLLPAKGMTLPFVSYGGSSLFAVALTMGFALALTRKRPKLEMRERPFAFMRSETEGVR